jgi:hypothetical protein
MPADKNPGSPNMSSDEEKKPDLNAEAGNHQNRPSNEHQSPLTATSLPPRIAGNAIEDAPDATGAKQTREKQDDWKRTEALYWLAIADAAFGFCLVLFTLGQVIVGYWQWDATTKQYDAMTEQIAVMRVDQRPWLVFDIPQMATPKVGDVAYGKIRIRNSGKTPAVITGDNIAVLKRPFVRALVVEKFGSKQDYGGVLEIDELLSSLRETADRLGAELVVAPGEEIEHTMMGSEIIDQGAFDNLGKSVTFIAVPYIRYRDLSGTTHESWSCFVYDEHGRFRRSSRYHHMD